MSRHMQQSVAPTEAPIRTLVDIVRQNLNSGMAKMAINQLYGVFQVEFPEHRYQHNFRFADLEFQLLKGIREKSPVVAAFIEDESKTATLWKWRVHFVEIAGFGAVISDMLSSIKSPHIGTWRSHSSLKEPLYLEPFGGGSRLWSCLSKPWDGSNVTLAFFGHTHDCPRRLVSVHIPTQFPRV
jgi:hypothetical protein